jgi:isopenicillin-N epimerase
MGSLLPGGWKALRERNHTLAVHARRLLGQGLELDAPCPERMLGSMATIPLPQKFQGAKPGGKIDREQLFLYDHFRIEVPFNRVGPRRYLRLSAQIYNSLEDYERLASALEEMKGMP